MTVGGPGSGDSIRRRLESIEDQNLAPYAMRSADSAGRERSESESPVRTAYQRDRDRIIHANAFRRLRGKTQVFIAPSGDHYATRLSHALEVAQIARDIARALRLNEDLSESIALAHDLGHAPFGHAGQAALDGLLGDGYSHDVQSLRVVRLLEKSGRGLNLTIEVLDGIRTHRKPRESLAGFAVAPSSTLEAEAVRLSDAIAYINHDVDDAVRAQLIRPSHLPEDAIRHLGRSRSERINTVVCDIIATSFGQAKVAMSDDVLSYLDRLREYLFLNVYRNPAVVQEGERARRLVEALFEYLTRHVDLLPQELRDDPRGEGTERTVADYIAGMTDSFAINLFQKHFVPQMWPP
jgi:dGTPase